MTIPGYIALTLTWVGMVDAAMTFDTAPSAGASHQSIESVIEAPGPYGPLQGTFSTPAAASIPPLVLIIPGSGPTDRDGNSPLGIRASTYRMAAEGLSARGIASVRIDKRGLFGSSRAIPNPNAVSADDYADDVHAWIKVIRERTQAPCIWVMGHSEGGLVALIAAQNPAGICGVILAAALGRPFDEVLREQLSANPANAAIRDEAFGIISALKAGKRVDISEINPLLVPLFGPAVQNLLINEFSYGPAALIAALKIPALILQGERDIQVTARDAIRLKEANPAAKLVAIPGATHVLKFVGSPDRDANLATYRDPSLPLAPGIIEAIAEFIGGG